MTLTQTQIDELKTLVTNALDMLYQHDSNLILNAVNERSVVFRFGLYFNELLKTSSFSVYNLDCEYNRNLGVPKRTINFQNGVIPDVLLHRRNSNDENVLVLEFKAYWNNANRKVDIKKIQDFTSQAEDNIYKYGLGGVIELQHKIFTIGYYLDYTPA